MKIATSDPGQAPMPRPKLLVLASTYPRWRDDVEPGFVHELARRLADTFDVSVLCPHARGALERECMDGVNIIRYRYAPECLESLVHNGGIATNLRRSRWKLLLIPSFVACQVFNAWRASRSLGIDVIHAHWLVPQGCVAALLRILPGLRIPFVATSHGADLFALRGKFFDWMRRYVAGQAQRLTVVSNAMLAAIQGASRHARVDVVPMGTDLQCRFVVAQGARLPHEILFVGRLVEKKGLRHLIEALPFILDEIPQASLDVVGFGPEENILKQRVETLGLQQRVRFHGGLPQAALAQLYQRAAVFVAPFVASSSGDQEGLGLVMVEAIGCGCPVIAGDVPAVHDVLGNWPQCLIVPTEPRQLAAKVLSVLRDPVNAAALAIRIREDVKSRLDWQAVTRAYTDILMSALANGERHSERRKQR